MCTITYCVYRTQEDGRLTKDTNRGKLFSRVAQKYKSKRRDDSTRFALKSRSLFYISSFSFFPSLLADEAPRSRSVALESNSARRRAYRKAPPGSSVSVDLAAITAQRQIGHGAWVCASFFFLSFPPSDRR